MSSSFWPSPGTSWRSWYPAESSVSPSSRDIHAFNFSHTAKSPKHWGPPLPQILTQAQGYSIPRRLHSSLGDMGNVSDEASRLLKVFTLSWRIPWRVAKDRHGSYTTLSQLDIHPLETYTALSAHSHVCSGLPRGPLDISQSVGIDKEDK